VGADVARHARPQGIANGCLHVVVDNSPWLQELTLRAEALTGKVAARFDAVRSLRFTLGRLDGSHPPPEPAPTPRPTRALGPEDVREITESVAPIRDPEARAAARRLLAAARGAGARADRDTRGVE
jgi:hypothetical protein